jgi:hypothetical protein
MAARYAGIGQCREPYPTPWNFLEAGLAIMADLPVLVAGEEGLAPEGIFSHDVWGEGVHGVAIRIWAGGMEAGADPALKAWTIAVRRRTRARRFVSATPPSIDNSTD